MAWARDPKGYERQLGELVAQFQYNYDIHWQSWVYSDWQQDDSCTALKAYKVRHISCDTLLPFACERGHIYIRYSVSVHFVVVIIGAVGQWELILPPPGLYDNLNKR